MMRQTLPSLLNLVLALAVVAPAIGDDSLFNRIAQPVVQRTCLGCHDPNHNKGDVNLAPFTDEAAVRGEPDLWRRVADALTERTMPPQGKPQPTEDEREQAAAAILDALDAEGEPTDPGPAPARRLTRFQYNNTIRDLLGVASHPADNFPIDGSGGGGFDNNASTLYVPPILLEKYLTAATDVLNRADPARWRFASPGEGVSREQAAQSCIEQFASKAYRRPVEPDEVARLLRLFRKADARGDSFDASVKLALRGVLVSPSFLFVVQPAKATSEPYPISDRELAARLSYFLWASTPDDELLSLAERGTLSTPLVLEQQVDRMLADGRSRALAVDFAKQWLGIDRLATASEPDHRRFPTYTPALRDAMVEEAVSFFAGMLRENRPVIDLIQANYTYLNQALAEHYGIGGVEGPEFRLVGLDDPRRGGVLGMAAVLTLTSYPRRTSPVLRGKWVLEEILGTPPPPPPPNIKVLSADDKSRDGLSFRQRLEQHRKDSQCASCHAKLDPLGFGLENFDPIGRWRDQVDGQPVDAAGVLTGGRSFRGQAELKAILVEQKKDLFVRNLASRMLSYALARGIEPTDAPALRQIIAELEASGGGMRTLVAEVVASYPFRHRRGESKPEGPTVPAKLGNAQR